MTPTPTQPDQLERAREVLGDPHSPWSAVIQALVDVKGIALVETELCASQNTIAKWLSGSFKPRPSTQKSLRKFIADLLGFATTEHSVASQSGDMVQQKMREAMKRDLPGYGSIIETTGTRPWWVMDDEIVARHLPMGLSERKAGFVTTWDHPFRIRQDHPFYSGFINYQSVLASQSGGDALREAIRADVINTPETTDFMAGVPIEAIHQRERWGSDHDGGKTPFDWFWLIGYLAQKAAASAVAGDIENARHHTISTAAALANWHAALTGVDTMMRPGIAPPVGEAAHG